MKYLVIFYPPSQKTTGLPVDECEDNASADVTKWQAVKQSADNPVECIKIIEENFDTSYETG